jgi:NADH:ubiquinone oxidoreductase subunit 6 (subunit J)
MAEVFFFIAAAGALFGAIGVVFSTSNPFYSVLSLVGHLLSLAGLFLLLRAELLAAAQVVVYAGAVMVLYVFVVAYIGGEEPTMAPVGPSLRPVSILFVGVVLVELCIAIIGSGLSALDGEGAPFVFGFGTPEQIGELLLTKFLLAFELASILLLLAAVGAVVLARRRGGVGDQELGVPTYSVMDVVRPQGTGTMREAATGLPDVIEPDRGEPLQVGRGTEQERP